MSQGRRFLAFTAGLLLASGGCASTVEGDSQATEPGSGLVDVAQDIGLDVSHSAFRWGVSGDPVAMMGGGLCWIDVDSDGWLDLFVTDTWSSDEWATWNEDLGLPTTRLFRNTGGQFVDATESWNAGYEMRALGCAVADLDADGDADLYVTTERSNLLLINNEGEGFSEVAVAANADIYGWQAGVAAGDLDADGHMDLVLTGYADLNAPRSDADSGFPNTVEARSDIVLLGLGLRDGIPMFEAIDGPQLGLEPDGAEYGLDVVLIDIDGDGALDMHVANDTQPNRLYANQLRESGRFVDVGATTGVDDSGSGMGLAFNDVNGDALPDFGLTNLAGQGHRLFLSDGDNWQQASDQTAPLGSAETGWGIAFADLDSNGLQDVVVANGAIPIVDDAPTFPVKVFRGDVGGALAEWPIEETRVMPSLHGRAVAPADFDNDGDLDVAISSIGGSLVLLENNLDQSPSLTLDLSTPPAGTVLNINFDDGSMMRHQVGSGGHWLSSADPRIHIGLAERQIASPITITYPSGITVKLDVPAGGGFVSL